MPIKTLIMSGVVARHGRDRVAGSLVVISRIVVIP